MVVLALAALLYVDRPRVAAVEENSISFFLLPAGASVTVDGKPADGPLALKGQVAMPKLEPVKVVRFEEPLLLPQRPQPNGQRFLACTRTKFCGIMDLSGAVVFEAPRPKKGGWAEALAIAPDGHEAAFEYGQGKAVSGYLVWNEATGAKRYKADPKNLTLRRTLSRLGINEDFPE